MNDLQQMAFNIYIDSASFENDFKPMSEEAIAQKMRNEGHETSSSSINRWKNKFEWNKALENKITLAMSENKELKNIIQKSSLQTTVKNTKVDIERNNMIIAGSYEIMERELTRLINDQKQNGKLKSKEDIELFKFIATLSTQRHDKMLDRLALIPPESVSGDELISRLMDVTIDVEVEEDTQE
ncbi:hypothetical protein CPIN18021_0271 [Campylobacter pinnipediorum subsp. caledonicus]|uniref:Uncharacterized protein n=1 Tax=Campylobacter pinnipediorum subsp. caledonicus TaxID=1874362 RepID=A0A1S6U5R9_9BACT|nr:hypothetical protein [Campylobacter pinnipediorum]AQW87118.1 hypothetical protein CPIN18021_0271 [Campylobacter pinnipediorum subsp. caledonicus]